MKNTFIIINIPIFSHCILTLQTMCIVNLSGVDGVSTSLFGKSVNPNAKWTALEIIQPFYNCDRS